MTSADRLEVAKYAVPTLFLYCYYQIKSPKDFF